MSTDPRSRAWLELDGAALRRNLAVLRSRIPPGTGVLPMVKANAYGLGMEGVVARLETEAPWGYGVATTTEGLALRALGVRRPVLVVSPLPPLDVEPALAGGLTPAASSAEDVRALAGAAQRLGMGGAFHLEVDTGMGRAGVVWRDLVRDPAPVRRAIEAAAEVGLRWEGCYTHFHSADEPGTPGVSVQVERFRQALEALGAPPAGPTFRVHLSNSAAAMRGLPGWGDPVRPGIHLYGGSVGECCPAPDPVAHLRARVVRVRDAEAGESVGYGATHVATGPERWATLAVGYGDGLPRALGNRGRALLRGVSVPIVGRISMDMTVLEVSGVPGGPVRPGEVATLLGRDGAEVIGPGELAALAGTIDYEIFTGLGLRLPRIWME